jgi:hypothetical protein
MGRSWQVLIGHHQPGNEIAAVLCRATRPRFVNGQVKEIGYLGQLRVDKRYRGRWVLLHGLDALLALHADGRVSAYLSAISDENAAARGILVDHPRPHFPTHHEVARIYTMGIILRKPWLPLARRPSVEVGRGSPAQIGETVVQSYANSLRRLRPFYNLAAHAVAVQPLPGIGQHIHSAYASFVCVANDDLDIFGTLLQQVYRLAAKRGLAYLMIGLSERDPLLPIAHKYPHIAYHSTLYVASWEDSDDFHDHLDDRVPYIEIAAL